MGNTYERDRIHRSNPRRCQGSIAANASDLANGICRRDQIKAACDRMDRMREENRKLFGEQNTAVALIRETRDRP